MQLLIIMVKFRWNLPGKHKQIFCLFYLDLSLEWQGKIRRTSEKRARNEQHAAK